MFRGIIGLAFFTIFALASAKYILRLKKPEHILLAASLISAPWAGGIWVAVFKFDFRLTYFFLFAALALSFNKNKHIKNPIPSLISVPFFALIGWMLISAAQAYDPARAMGDGPITMLLNFVYLLTITKIVKNNNDLQFVIKSAFLGLFYTSLLSLVQYKIRMFEIGFIDSGSRGFMWWRPRAMFHHPNAYGMYQLIILPIVFRQIIISFKSRNKRQGSFYTVIFLTSCFTLFITQNRGSWIGLAAGMLITVGIDFFRKGSKKTRKVMVRIIIGLLIVSAVPLTKYGPRMYTRMFEGKNAFDRKAETRKSYDVDAWTQLKLHPVFGVGVSNVRYYSSIIFTHNLYLLMLSETGYPGFLLFVLYMFGLIKLALKSMKSKNAYVSAIGSGLLTTMIGLLIASYPGPDYAITPQVSSQLWIVAGIMISLVGIEKRMIKFQRLKKRQQMLQQIDRQKEIDITEQKLSDNKKLQRL